MTAISYHDSVNKLHAPDLAGRGPFGRLAWFRLLEGSGYPAVIVEARDEDAAACLPLIQGPRGLQELSNWYAFTWAPLVSADATPSSLTALARDLMARTSRIDLAKLPDEDGTATKLENAFASAGWITRREACDVNHILRVGGRSYADYLASRPGQLRTTLKRKAKKLEIHLARSFDAGDWSTYEAIYAESWKPEEGDPELLRAFAEAESAAGRYLFGVASHDGKPIAAQFWTIDDGTAFIHKLAHLQGATGLSPGSVLTAALFEHAIDTAGVDLVDFGTGDDPYKRDWMEEVRPRYRLTCLRPNDPRNWPVLARYAVRKLVSRRRAG